MALIVFLRGINVGGHRTLRPSVLAKQLGAYDVVNVGAAGTFIVRKPGTPTKFLAALRQKLPLDAVVAFCDSSDLIRLEMDNPFRTERAHPDLIQFVSILSKAGRSKATLPVAIPEDGAWFVRIMGSRNRLLFGVYRRHMKTIGHLSRIDDLFGAPATTRSWSTILSVLRTLKSNKGADHAMRPVESLVKPPHKRSSTQRRVQAVANPALSRERRYAASPLQMRGYRLRREGQ